MRTYVLVCLMIGLFIPFHSMAQVGEKVTDVKVLNADNVSVNLPFLGQKNLLIFYADPGRPRENKSFRDYFKTHPINSPEVASYGVVNMAAAPLIPNSLIRKMAQKETEGTDGKVYFDPDNILANAWKLPGADNNFAVIFVGKDRVIQFYKAGQLTPDDQTKVLELIAKAKEGK